MKKNTWFENQFLQSIFERLGANNSKWLTQKQTAICVRNMDIHHTRYADAWNEGGEHDWYTYDWNGRKVTLHYSKKNYCGCIEFANTQDEYAESCRKQYIDGDRATIIRVKELNRNIKDLEHEIEELEKDIEYDVENNEGKEVDFYNSMIIKYKKDIDRYESELKMYVA